MQPPPPGEEEGEEETGIAHKVLQLQQKIDNKQQEIASKEKEIQEHEQQQQQQQQQQGPADEIQQLLKLLALGKERSKLSALKEELWALKLDFTTGKYFGFLDVYWKTEAVPVASHHTYQNIQWSNYQRTKEEACKIQVRCWINKEINSNTPYEDTRAGAMDKKFDIVSSDRSRTSQSNQNEREIRNSVWPVDIFGNKATRQHIAHLLPAGCTFHKEWMPVAAVILGMDHQESSSDQLKKAVRGFKPQGAKNKVPGSGVVHFVSNKLRMNSQGHVFDGGEAFGLLIPTLSLSEAKEWNGEAYNALFVMGKPSDGQGSQTCTPTWYNDVQLNTETVMLGAAVRDATSGEIEDARMTLIHAVLALRNMIANLGDEKLKSLNIKNSDGLKEAQGFAQQEECVLPQVLEAREDRKPLCLVRFGKVEETDKHPPPDPLLLAYKAACVWGTMTKKRLLANGEEPDLYPDMTEGDYLAELAFLEGRSGFKRPKTWEDLAVGLGQPNGYQE